jgi:hypothetical protein
MLAPNTSLCVEVSDVHHVWACMLLAAQHPRVQLVIDPRVAADISSLMSATELSLPAAFPHHLIALRDPNAEASSILSRDGFAVDPWDAATPAPSSDQVVHGEKAAAVSEIEGDATAAPDFEVEEFPEPDAQEEAELPVVITHLHESVRAALMANSHTARGLKRLKEQLDHTNQERHDNVVRIKESFGTGGLSAELVGLLHEPPPAEVKTRLADQD